MWRALFITGKVKNSLFSQFVIKYCFIKVLSPLFIAEKPGCDKTSDYKFFLAFENSNCKDYVTEKFWVNGFKYEAIPVYMGAKKESVKLR